MTNEELALKIQQGDTELLPVLWEQVRKFIFSFALKYYWKYTPLCASSGVTEDDLQQEGYFALIDAVKAWTPESGFKLLAFLHYPLKNHFNKICGIRTARGRGEPLNKAASLDEPIPGTEDITRGDAVPDPEAGNAFEEAEHAVYIQKLRADLEAAIDNTGPRRGQVVRQYYFEDRTLKQIGDNIGVSAEMARNLKTQAFRKLCRDRRLAQYKQEIIDRYAYHGSLSSFRYSGMSSTEFTFEVMEREIKERERWIEEQRLKRA